MKITVDTNVLISATFWEGISSRIIDLIEQKQIELVLSLEIIQEFSDVLNYKEIQDKIRNKNLEMKRTVAKIVTLSTLVEPLEKLDAVSDDPDDNKILECAKTGKVDFIVSRDNDLLRLNQFDGIPIVSPEEFFKRFSCT